MYLSRDMTQQKKTGFINWNTGQQKTYRLKHREEKLMENTQRYIRHIWKKK